jgi:hypothetical protein
MWNPSQEYGFAWAAVPPKPVVASAADVKSERSRKPNRVAEKRD